MGQAPGFSTEELTESVTWTQHANATCVFVCLSVSPFASLICYVWKFAIFGTTIHIDFFVLL